MILGAFVDDEEGDGGGGGGGGEWKYTGEYFDKVFQGFPKDEGVVYQHYPRDIIFLGKVLYPITVMQAMKKGNLVTTEDSDRVVWVETKRRYEDDEKLDQGYYIRRGSFEYETALGAEKTVARYVEVTDKKMLQNIENAKQELEAKRKAEEEARAAKLKAEEEAREAERKAEEERREAERRAEEEAKRKAAEQGAYDLDIPIKSLCGFKLGAPPSQVSHLIQNDDGTPVEDFLAAVWAGWSGGSNDEAYYACTYRLVKPFRLFTRARMDFKDRGVGLHLDEVRLIADISNVSKESWTKEMMTIVGLLEKKFGIKFEKGGYYSGCDGYTWYGDGCHIVVFMRREEHDSLSLNLESSAHLKIYNLDCSAKEVRKEAGKKTIELDATSGADDL